MSYLDIHILQTVPPSNLNRDDTGSPKTAYFGGSRRARVSSQAWKRATRQAFREFLDPSEVGYRTTRLVELIAARCQRLDSTLDDASAATLAEGLVKALGLKAKPPRAKKKADQDETDNALARTEYLVFFSDTQIENLARLALDNGGSVTSKQAKEVADANHSIDVALFGRMIADDASLNVDAAVQVAHALSTHAVDNEFDFYTAVDDLSHEDESGAGMIGTVEFNSSTLYRYATVNIDGLVKNLGSTEAATRALASFVRAFASSMPTGKQNTFGNRTLPDAVVMMLRDRQPVSLVGAFEQALSPTDDGWVRGSAARLASHAAAIEETFGEAPVRTLVAAIPTCAQELSSLGEAASFEQLVEASGELIGDSR